MTYDRLNIADRIGAIQIYANRHGAALALHPSFWRQDVYDQADRLDGAVDVLEERLAERYADVVATVV